MITGSEVELHVKCFSEGAEKAGDEFGAVVRSDMFQNAVFGEHVHNEQHGKVFGSAVNGCRNEYAGLFKSMQRQRVLSFLRAKITRAPWEEEVWQINLVRRWSSRKLQRTSSSD